MDREEVLLAMIHSLETIFSTAENTLFLMSKFSTIASITKSDLAIASKLSVYVIFDLIALASVKFSFSFSTNRTIILVSFSFESSNASGLVSNKITLHPAVAAI